MIPRLRCQVVPGLIRAELRRSRRLVWAAEAEWDSPVSLREAVAHLAGRVELPAFSRVVRFEIAEPLLQRRTLPGLPRLAPAKLAASVALAPQRYFRRSSSPLVTDARWIGSRKDGGVQAIAVDLTLVQALSDGAREAGLIVAEVTPAGESEFSLLPPQARSLDDRRRAGWTIRLGAAAAVAWLALGGAIIGDHFFERHRVDGRLAELQGPLNAMLAAQAGADSAERMVRRLAVEEQLEGEVVAQLFRVTAALPDSSYLTQLRIDASGVGLVAGAARRPAAVLAALESGAGLFRPRFEGRTTRDVVVGRSVERFTIGFGSRERPQ